MMALNQPMTMLAQWVEPLQGGVEQVRARLGREVVSLLSSDPDADPESFARPVGDPGLFSPDSPVWEVHADPSMFVGGIRALLLQAMHPLAMAGVAEHSDYKRQPLRRLQRTAMFIRDTTYGNSQQVERSIATVRRMHERVRGVAPDGRPYSASDPDLLRWVHAAEIDSFLCAHARYGAHPLTPAQTDRYIDEMAEVALRLGADWVPRSAAELQDYLADVRPELHAGQQARETAEWLLRTAAHPSGWLPQMILNAAAIGLLPGWVRRDLGLVMVPLLDPFEVIDPLAVRPAAMALVRTLGWVLNPHLVRDAAQRRFVRPSLRSRRSTRSGGPVRRRQPAQKRSRA
jgi:uncharacterized protein (DUF2236 family)